MTAVTRTVTRRTRGGARNVSGVTHLGGDRWRVRVYAGMDPLTGKQRQLSRTFRAPNKTVANAAAEKLRSQMRDELTTTRERAGTVAELGDRFLALKRRDRAPKTMENYQRIVTRIVETFGHLPIERLTGRLIDDWYTRLMEEGMKPANIQHHHALLRAMLRQAVRSEMTDRVATVNATVPRGDKFETTPPTIAVARLLIADAGGDLGAALHFAASTGARRGEVVGLRWGDIEHGRVTIRRSISELKGGVLHVGPPKGRRPRTFGITSQTWLTLMRQCERARIHAERLHVDLGDDGWVFASPRKLLEQPYAPSWLSHGWQRLRDRHGVRFRPHDLRHANATWLTDAGIPAATGAKRLGHAQTATYSNVYDHPTDEADARAVAVLELALPAASAPASPP